jgi:hypothetical protein
MTKSVGGCVFSSWEEKGKNGNARIAEYSTLIKSAGFIINEQPKKIDSFGYFGLISLF